MLEESMEFHRGHGGGIFGPEATTPPEIERVTTHAVWAVEIYTPLHAARMVERLRALGVDTDRSHLHPPSDSVRRGRSFPLGGSWVNLGMLVPRDREGWAFFDRIAADLPSGVRAAFPTVWTVTSSLSALVLQFVLEDERAGEVERVARRNDFEAKGRLLPGGRVTVDPPDNVKQAAIDDARHGLRSLPVEWIGEHVPGAFTARGGATMPTAELVTTEVGAPLAEEERGVEYMRFLGLGWDPFAWRSDELKEWRLSFDWEDRSLIVAGRRSDVVGAGQLEHRGSDESWAMAGVANDYLRKDLVIWAAARHLVECHDRLSAIRDAGQGLASDWLPTFRLKKIGREFLRDSLDARTAAAELKRFAADRQWFTHDAAEWTGIGRLSDRDLLQSFREGIRANANAVLSAEERLRDGLLVESTILSAVANLRVQRWVLGLTALALVAAAVSLYLTLASG
jgi:hypothetical protein